MKKLKCAENAVAVRPSDGSGGRSLSRCKDLGAQLPRCGGSGGAAHWDAWSPGAISPGIIYIYMCQPSDLTVPRALPPPNGMGLKFWSLKLAFSYDFSSFPEGSSSRA